MSFEQLKLIPQLQKAVAKEGYTIPTPIQKQAIPPLLEGKDLIGIAQTGTGKTAAFVLPLLQLMTEHPKPPVPRAPRLLVLAPTRELAAQIGDSFAVYGQYLRFKTAVIFGGVTQVPQVKALTQGADIVVATPGRLLDLMQQRHISLQGVEYFVLDEADRMLDMGFIHDVRKIVDSLPRRRQSLFFSATMSPPINDLASRMLTQPVHIRVTPEVMTVALIEQRIFFVDQADKDNLLLSLLQHEHLKCVLLFTKTKHKANKVAQMLSKHNIRADAIHGNKSQAQRTRALDNFKSGRVRVLAATDIAARGIDIDNISHIINYDMPNEAETYVHRIGRTARAGAAGTAYSFCAADERDFLRAIERLTRKNIEVMDHKFHSEKAKHATGSAARPPPRQQFKRNNRRPQFRR